MKINTRTTIILFIATLFFQFNYAQDINSVSETENEEQKVPIKIGFRVGYSLSKINDSNDNMYASDYESVSGVDFGFTTEFFKTDLISVKTELNYTQRNGKRSGMQPVGENELSDQLNQFLPFIGLPPITDENPLWASFEAEQKLSYLEIPVLVKFGWGDDFRFFAEVGPYVGILTRARQVTSGTSQFYFDEEGEFPVFVPNPDGDPLFVELPAQSLDADTNIKENLKTVNFGGIVGIGASKNIGEKSEISLDARASYSFNYIQINDVFGKSNIGGVIVSLGYAYTIN